MITIVSVTSVYIRRTCIRSRSWSHNCVTIVTNMNTVINVNIYIVSVSVNCVAAYVGISVARVSNVVRISVT